MTFHFFRSFVFLSTTSYIIASTKANIGCEPVSNCPVNSRTPNNSISNCEFLTFSLSRWLFNATHQIHKPQTKPENHRRRHAIRNCLQSRKYRITCYQFIIFQNDFHFKWIDFHLAEWPSSGPPSPTATEFLLFCRIHSLNDHHNAHNWTMILNISTANAKFSSLIFR